MTKCGFLARKWISRFSKHGLIVPTLKPNYMELWEKHFIYICSKVNFLYHLGLLWAKFSGDNFKLKFGKKCIFKKNSFKNRTTGTNFKKLMFRIFFFFQAPIFLGCCGRILLLKIGFYRQIFNLPG